MSESMTFNPAPAKSYEALLFQFNALLRLYNSSAAQRAGLSGTVADLRKKIGRNKVWFSQKPRSKKIK